MKIIYTFQRSNLWIWSTNSLTLSKKLHFGRPISLFILERSISNSGTFRLVKQGLPNISAIPLIMPVVENLPGYPTLIIADPSLSLQDARMHISAASSTCIADHKCPFEGTLGDSCLKSASITENIKPSVRGNPNNPGSRTIVYLFLVDPSYSISALLLLPP